MHGRSSSIQDQKPNVRNNNKVTCSLHQPSAAKTLVDFDKKDQNGTDPELKDKAQFGLRSDLYHKKGGLKDKGAATLSREWTDQETLLLLEGLEMFKDDWNKV